MDDEELRRAAKQLVNTYQNDLEDSLVGEIVHCAALLRTPVMK